MDAPKRVLVVDDEEAIRLLVRTVLERSGFEVDVARDGCEAIERLAASDYDVVLLDVMMPRLDGFGVVHEMESRFPALLARTLLVTASNRKDLDRLPIRGVIHKPFSVGDLVRETAECAAARVAAAQIPTPEVRNEPSFSAGSVQFTTPE
jgi:CheY-like chemotaxis protein